MFSAITSLTVTWNLILVDGGDSSKVLIGTAEGFF
jgi:hypothetical protein